jgi:hypothetical protein
MIDSFGRILLSVHLSRTEQGGGRRSLLSPTNNVALNPFHRSFADNKHDLNKMVFNASNSRKCKLVAAQPLETPSIFKHPRYRQDRRFLLSLISHFTLFYLKLLGVLFWYGMVWYGMASSSSLFLFSHPSHKVDAESHAPKHVNAECSSSLRES